MRRSGPRRADRRAGGPRRLPRRAAPPRAPRRCRGLRGATRAHSCPAGRPTADRGAARHRGCPRATPRRGGRLRRIPPRRPARHPHETGTASTRASRSAKRAASGAPGRRTAVPRRLEELRGRRKGGTGLGKGPGDVPDVLPCRPTGLLGDGPASHEVGHERPVTAAQALRPATRRLQAGRLGSPLLSGSRQLDHDVGPRPAASGPGGTPDRGAPGGRPHRRPRRPGSPRPGRCHRRR